jgi:7,8-dihydroneopterin aldolase/epimerase/oxygenase
VSYRVSLTGVRARGFHGVFATERRDGQDFVVDAVLDVDGAEGPGGTGDGFGGPDQLDATVDYGSLAQRLHDTVAGEPVNLIETLADRLAAVCLADPRVRRVEVTVHKPAAPIEVPFGDVAVTVTRERASG